MGERFGFPFILVGTEDDIKMLRQEAKCSLKGNEFSLQSWGREWSSQSELPSPSSQEIPAGLKSGRTGLMPFWNKGHNQGDEATRLNQPLSLLISDENFGSHPLWVALKTDEKEEKEEHHRAKRTSWARRWFEKIWFNTVTTHLENIMATCANLIEEIGGFSFYTVILCSSSLIITKSSTQDHRLHCSLFWGTCVLHKHVGIPHHKYRLVWSLETWMNETETLASHQI